MNTCQETKIILCSLTPSRSITSLAQTIPLGKDTAWCMSKRGSPNSTLRESLPADGLVLAQLWERMSRSSLSRACSQAKGSERVCSAVPYTAFLVILLTKTVGKSSRNSSASKHLQPAQEYKTGLC